MKDYLKYIWLLPICFGLWLIWKLFVKKGNDEPEPIIDNTSGLTPNDIDIYNRVITLIDNGSNPYDMLTGSPVYTLMWSSAAVENATELGQNLARVEDKTLFAEVYARKRKRLLTNDIINVYGDKVYQLIAQNVPGFSYFII